MFQSFSISIHFHNFGAFDPVTPSSHDCDHDEGLDEGHGRDGDEDLHRDHHNVVCLVFNRKIFQNKTRLFLNVLQIPGFSTTKF